ncbi:DNA polymerase III subunit delta [Mycoplasma miroungirhinis]|uniref:DNA-directed DNA polymerase n=1 Tax=Mycoplasma miroungirhinis TaxID=754516 RepID=A0A6M4JAU5_9MOLU|nr:hypothetical protein [Mycoplasma miroungirhinis]QJR44093.1 hypothetical protein HLA92_01425 [Mycoplasma miroungirhinis]
MKFIYGEEEFFIDHYIKTIQNDFNNLTDKYIFEEDTNIQDIFNILTSVNIFNEKRLLIIKNSPLLFCTKNQQNIETFINILENLTSDIEIIFSLYIPKLKQFKPSNLFLFLEKKAEVKKFLKVNEQDLTKFIKKYVQINNSDIEEQAINKIIQTIPKNLFLITSTLDKFIQTNKIIKVEDIENQNEIFYENVEWITNDSLLKNQNLQQFYKKILYQLDFGISPRNIVAQIINIFSIAMDILSLKKQNTFKEISALLNIHEYRLKLIYQFLEQHNTDFIEKQILFLSKLDIDIKQGNLDENIALNYLILNLFRTVDKEYDK